MGQIARELGLDAMYGLGLVGERVTEVPPDLAPLFAAAHRCLRRRPAAVHLGDGVLLDPAGRPVVAPAAIDTWLTPTDELVATVQAASRPAVLAGPGAASGACR